MKKIFNIKVATILLAIVAVLGAFGLLKDKNTSFDIAEDEKPYCLIKKEDVLHDVKPASDNYSLYDDNYFRHGIHNTTSHYYKFVDKLYESQRELSRLNAQFTRENITPEGVKPMTKEQQDTLDKAKKEVEKDYQELLIQYRIYKPIFLAFLKEAQKRNGTNKQGNLYYYTKYENYPLYDTNCIDEID